ncbi:alpha/beta hydrolase [Pseudodesulfovibrio portus]|uniref:Alpha/beta hydrolase n=1 Tax=Pseudodesulfovibrio portus TaxID=231439 RepID=A0ABM8AS05_9BACT|nr:alpha/beta hydrolase [Pseudodesulfovibrio portus]BDQ34236.1 alpha/beta hydrolase [Pseudodesulfovibrio portus]
MWTAATIAGALALLYGSLVAWVYISQPKMLYCPRRELVSTPADAGLAYEDVYLTTASGTAIHAWWLPHEQPRFTLLFSHGNGGNISHRLESLRIFHDLGLSVLIYDYSGYGRSQGVPGEEATRADARAAWEWLVAERLMPPGSIILFGRSLGGGVAADLARHLCTHNATPAGLILESTFTSVPDMGVHHYPWLPVRRLARFHYDSENALRNVTLPALFLHSRDDDIVPFALGKQLHDAYGGPKSFLELLGDHNTGFLSTGQAYVDGLDRFLSLLEQPPGPEAGQ